MWVHVYEDFGENISPEFQEAVEESAKKVQDFNVYLREIGFDNVISQAESAEFNRRVNETCDEAIKTIQGKKEEAQLGLKELFIADDQVIDESEQKVLDALAKSSDKQIAEVTTLEGEILAIKQKAVDEKRALNDQEIADIESKNARIRQIELEAVGGTEEELLYAKNEFNARAKNLDAESASELLQEKVKARNDEIVKIKASYDTEIELLKSKLDEMNAEDRKAAEEQINNLEKDKQDKINKQEELYEEYLAIIRENNPNLMDELNKFSGEVLSNADKECKERLDLYRETYGDLSQIQETGLYTIYNKESHTWNQVAAVVDEGTGEITAMYSNMVGASAGWSESMAKDAEKMIKKADDASDVIAQLVDANDYYVDSAGNVVQAATGIASEMEQVTKKTDGSPCVLSFQYIGDRPPDSLERLVIPTCHQCVFMLLIFFLRLPVPDTHFLDQFRGNPISLDRERMISVLRILFIDGSQIPLHVINLSRGFGKQFYNLIPHVLPHQAQACDVRRHLINKGRSWLILERIFFSHVIPEPPHRGNDAVGDFAVPDVPERPGYSSGTKRSPVFRQYL